MWYHFPVTVLWNSLLRYKTLHIPQLMLPHLYMPFSSSLESRIFSFDLTKWSFSVFGLRNATRGGDGNTAFNLRERIVCLCAFFNISWTLFSAGWYVKTKVRLSFLSCFSCFLTDFLYSWSELFESHYEPFLSYNPCYKTNILNPQVVKIIFLH